MEGTNPSIVSPIFNFLLISDEEIDRVGPSTSHIDRGEQSVGGVSKGFRIR